MSELKISDLKPVGANSLKAKESFLTDLEVTDTQQIHGGTLGLLSFLFNRGYRNDCGCSNSGYSGHSGYSYGGRKNTGCR